MATALAQPMRKNRRFAAPEQMDRRLSPPRELHYRGKPEAKTCRL